MRDPELVAMEAELARRRMAKASIPNAPPPPPPEDQELSAMEDELAKRKKPKNIYEETGLEPQEFSIPQRAAQYAHGMAGAGESVVDLISKMPRSTLMPSEVNISEPEPEPYSIAGKITKPIEKLAGKKLTPEEGDTIGKIVHGAGEFSLPMPGSGYLKAGKSLTGLAKTFGKELGAAAGASTLLHGTPSLTEEGTIGRGAEDITKIILGTKGGELAAKGSMGLAKSVRDIASKGKYRNLGAEPSLEELSESMLKGKEKPKASIGAKILSAGAKPNVNVLNKAEKLGIELPFNVGMQGKAQNFLANNYLKSMFASEAYKEVGQKANQKMINKVKDSIETLGPSNLKPAEASNEFLNFIKEDEKIFKKQSDVMYEKARKALKPEDSVIPNNTIKSIDSMKELLQRDIKSPATMRVVKVVKEIADKWGVKPKGDFPINTAEWGEKQVQSLSKALDEMKGKKRNIPIEKLIGVRKELNSMIDYDPEVRGVQGYLSRLSKDITKDIESTSNKEFLNEWKNSNKFFVDNVVTRFREGLGHSIMNGEAPIDAFNKMNSVENIRQLQKVAGETPAGKEVFDSLKKAKTREIFQNTIEGGLEGEKLSAANFAKLFKKGEKKQEILEELIGKQEYNKLTDIADIAEEFSKSGKELLNTSGTAIAAHDITKLEKLAGGALALLTFSDPALALKTATVGVGTPYVLSRLVSNPRLVREARAYAIARQKHQEKYARTILNRMFDIAKDEARAMKNVAIEEITNKEGETK